MSETDPFLSEEGDGADERTRLEAYFMQSLEVDLLLRVCPDEEDTIDQIVNLLVDTCSSKRRMLRVAGDDKPAEVVRSRFMKLNADHIRFVLKCLAESTAPVRNMKQYLLAALYNAPTTCENLGVGLAREGKKVLLVDADPQGSLTIVASLLWPVVRTACGFIVVRCADIGWQQPDELPVTLSTLMAKAMNDQCIPPGEGILHHAEGVDLIPANIELAGLEVALVNSMSREKMLKQVLDSARREYDYAATFLGVLALVGLAAGGGIYAFMKQKQKKQAEKEALDPDADYTEDKGDFEIPMEDEPEEPGEEDNAEE